MTIGQSVNHLTYALIIDVIRTSIPLAAHNLMGLS
jgi:hypothetical protein